MDSEARTSKETEMKKKFHRNQKRITPSCIHRISVYNFDDTFLKLNYEICSWRSNYTKPFTPSLKKIKMS